MISSNARLFEDAKIVAGAGPIVPSSTTPDIVSLKNYNNAAIIIQGRVGTNLTTGSIALIQATSVAGTTNKALVLNGTSMGTIWLNTDCTASDTLVATAISAASTSTPTTTSKTWMMVVPIEANQLDTSNGYDCFGLTLGDMPNCTVSATYILGNARYGGATPPAAITD